MSGRVRRTFVALVAVALGLAGAVVVAAPAQADTIPVTSLLDDNSGGTLREAIVAAEANSDPSNTINITVSGVINLLGPLDVITKTLTITGPGDTLTVRKGSWVADIFTVRPEAADQDFVFQNFRIDGDGANSGRALVSDNLGDFGARNITLRVPSVTDFVTFGNGGAVLINDVSGRVLIDGGTYDNNWAANNGGAIYVGYSNDITVTGGAEFTDCFNGTGNGGAIALEVVQDLLIDEGSEFTGNDAWNSGGGISVSQFQTATLNDVLFDDNYASQSSGGGAYFFSGRSVSITDGIFTSNEAPGGGGFLADTVDTLVTVQSSEFTDNEALNGDGGGFLVGGSPTLAVQVGTKSTFTENSADSPDGLGRGGAIAAITYGTFTSNDVTYTENWSGSGGAIYSGATFNTFLVDLSTFKQNEVETEEAYGGAIHVIAMPTATQSVTLRDSTFDGNIASGLIAYGGAFAIGDTADDTVVSVQSSTFTKNVVDGFFDGEGASIAVYETDTTNGRVDVVNSTFVENEDTGAYAVWVSRIAPTGLLTIRNTTLLGIGGVLVDDNEGGAQIINSILEAVELESVELDDDGDNLFTAQYSLFSSSYDSSVIASAATNRFDVADMKLGILGNNGGPTQTRLPATDSPAINTGNAAIETSLPTYDQRGTGFNRVSGVALDIGAVEIQVPPLPATGSTIPLWIPIVGGVVLLVGILAIAYTVISRRRLHAAEAAAAPPADPTVS